mmetsp:Transcript_22584/g.33354  ORF Transcript_22584/g.33354 Transcript_22584/m.33354 type:complete len:307 (+) Transcript_22584:58-978(+)|eukprot:CAMPEP_0194244224 /NCGR_PEP_ID=MMETSP0158-20130606/10529_1 /TAXON_ID=33649 /ORGANISM="Thalassionema nitzschioides, Strain L26-B" /LENGTH=306 /DNA_ID=CAMNT_0038979631 /DNA_START=31 /DNA_END=951 /DNA_ORIENTATION=-
MTKINRGVANNEFVFDPFGLNNEVSSPASPRPPQELQRLTQSDAALSAALPPKVIVKFRAHEEVSSLASNSPGEEGASSVHIEGKLAAQVTSSDAMRNVPFCLVAANSTNEDIKFVPNDNYAVKSSSQLPNHAMSLFQIPKTEYGAVTIGSYSLTETVQHMPLLVERKVSAHSNMVRVAVQIRSKLSNLGDLKDITIAVSLPDRVNGETVEVLKGSGIYDDLKRTIKWSKSALVKGESFMVSAEAKLFPTSTNDEGEDLKFPVLLRCISSEDQISTVDFGAIETAAHPSSVSHSCSSSFRLLHRLP